MDRYDVAFEGRRGLKKIGCWGVPIIFIFLVVTSGLAVFMYLSTSSAARNGTSPFDNPEVSTVNYAESYLDAVACMDKPNLADIESCNVSKNRSGMIVTMSNQIMVVNGKSFPVTDEATVHKAVLDSPLSQIDYNSLGEGKGSGSMITFADGKGGSIAVSLTQDPTTNEYRVTSLQVTPDTQTGSDNGGE